MDKEELIRGILTAGKHEGGLIAGKFKKVDDFENLKFDCLKFHEDWLSQNPELDPTRAWKSHIIWSEDDSSDINHSKGHFLFPEKYPSLSKFLKNIPDIIGARINVMGTGNKDFYHQENVVFRYNNEITMNLLFHVPIVTNNECALAADREIHKFSEEGTIYYFNPSTIHTPLNKGSGVRIHLLFYCLLTENLLEWIKEIQPLDPVAYQEMPTDHIELTKFLPKVSVEDHIYENIKIVPSLVR